MGLSSGPSVAIKGGYKRSLSFCVNTKLGLINFGKAMGRLGEDLPNWMPVRASFPQCVQPFLEDRKNEVWFRWVGKPEIGETKLWKPRGVALVRMGGQLEELKLRLTQYSAQLSWDWD
jgi:hypothetical protein